MFILFFSRFFSILLTTNMFLLDKCEEEYVEKFANPFPAAARGKIEHA